MPPEPFRDESNLHPTRTNPPMPELFAPQEEPAQENQQDGDDNEQLANEEAARRRRNRLPFLLRLFLSSQIARYLRARRENEQQQQEGEQEQPQEERAEAEPNNPDGTQAEDQNAERQT